MCQENIFDIANFSANIQGKYCHNKPYARQPLPDSWKDVGHMYFWSSDQSVSLMLNYFQIMTLAMLGTPASNIYFLHVLFWLQVSWFQKHLILIHFLSFFTQISEVKHDVIIQNSQSSSRSFHSWFELV
jgi:hypothetical protein